MPSQENRTGTHSSSAFIYCLSTTHLYFCCMSMKPNMSNQQQQHHHRLSDHVLASKLATQHLKQQAEKEAVMPHPSKVTVFMRQSLDRLHSALVCPLCCDLLENPSTLACGHTFCWKCIEAYSYDNPLCPSE